MNRMIHRICLYLLLLAVAGGAGAQNLKWVHIEHLPANTNGKLYFVQFYTSWCQLCKRMDNETYGDSVVARLLSHHFIPVRFNAEGNTSFRWNGVKYSPTPTMPGVRHSVHMFAKSVLGKQLGFPAFAIFDADQKMLTVMATYKNAHDLTDILCYYASGAYKQQPFERYVDGTLKDKRKEVLRSLNAY